MEQRATLDGISLAEQALTLSEAMDLARQRASGRLIVEILADGLPVPPADIDHPPDRRPYCGLLEMFSTDRRAVIDETIAALDAAFEELTREQESVSRLLRRGELTSALGSIGEVLARWESVRGAIVLLCRAGAAGPELESLMSELARRLREVRDAVVSEDWAQLADLMQHELQSVAESIRFKAGASAGGRGEI